MKDIKEDKGRSNRVLYEKGIADGAIHSQSHISD